MLRSLCLNLLCSMIQGLSLRHPNWRRNSVGEEGESLQRNKRRNSFLLIFDSSWTIIKDLKSQSSKQLMISLITACSIEKLFLIPQHETSCLYEKMQHRNNAMNTTLVCITAWKLLPKFLILFCRLMDKITFFITRASFAEWSIQSEIWSFTTLQEADDYMRILLKEELNYYSLSEDELIPDTWHALCYEASNVKITVDPQYISVFAYDWEQQTDYVLHAFINDVLNPSKVTKDWEILFVWNYNDCFWFILKHQWQSVDRATTYWWYKINQYFE